MKFYCLKCRKIIECKNLKVLKTKNGRIILLSNCTVCDDKKLNSIKEKEDKELLSILTGIKH